MWAIAWIAFQGWLSWKLVKLGLALLLIGVMWGLADTSIDFLITYLDGLEDTTILGQSFPVIAMMRYMGLFQALSILIGAHVSVLGFRILDRIMGWV